MSEITTRQRSFIEMMKESEELARHGIELLLKRADAETFFDSIERAGLFHPSRNPAPIASDGDGMFRLPYWSMLDYLMAVGKIAGERNDMSLAAKVMAVIRTVSNHREPDGAPRSNHYTWWKFAEIVGFLPSSAVSAIDLNMLSVWLSGRFDHGMVGQALAAGILPKLLSSDVPEDKHKVVVILGHFTAIKWVKKLEMGELREEPVTVVDGYWLKKMIAKNAHSFGAKIGKHAADIFLERIREIYVQGDRDKYSWVHRPAIEESSQNHSWKGPENRFVDGLRDVLLAWVENDHPAAQQFVSSLLSDSATIARRIGIYVLGQRWDHLKGIYPSLISPSFFHEAHLHELYGLLQERFHEMTAAEKADTLAAIRDIAPSRIDTSERTLKRTQRNWLKSIVGKGFDPADRWYLELQSDQTLGVLPEHPDFLSYMESWSGPGPSPISVPELLAATIDDTIISKLNSFQQSNDWKAPTTRALADNLEEAVICRPETFVELLPKFLEAKRPYQYGLINGFKRAWDTETNTNTPIDWTHVWAQLVEFFEQLIGHPTFWTEAVIEDKDRTPNRDWIPPLISDFLKAGTRQDEKAYPARLLPRTWILVSELVDKSETNTSSKDDPMTEAINSSKGKAVEALLNHALRMCRIEDQTTGGHATAWQTLQCSFDNELAKCKDANFEFSTLLGAYCANVEYLDNSWLRANVNIVFSEQHTGNFQCAIAGLAYAPFSRAVYEILKGNGVLVRALKASLVGRHARERLIHRIAYAYLWEDEDLKSPHFSYLFESRLLEDLEDASGFFWSINNQPLSEIQKQQILSFLDKCISWGQCLSEVPVKLFSSLSRLSCYLDVVGKRESEWLVALAPYVGVDYNADNFIEELGRLVDLNPVVIEDALDKVLEKYTPHSDFEGKLKALLAKLVEHGGRLKVELFTNKLRHIPEMRDLFLELTSSN